jgi:hypothetical protein
MPLLSTKGGASATGFGMFGTSVKFNVTTVIYYSSTTWTAPAGVSNILTLVGAGSGGSSDSWSENTISYAQVFRFNQGSWGSGVAPSWNTLYNLNTSDLAIANAGGTGIRTVNTNSLSYFSYPDNTWQTIGPSSYTYIIRGTATTFTSGYTQTSGTIVHNTLNDNWNGFYVKAEMLYSGGPGSATTAFGYTFPGGGYGGSTGSGVGYPATPITYNNIAVAPGTGYSLSIPSGGSVSISYLTPA